MLHQQWYVSQKLDELAREDEARRRGRLHEQPDAAPPQSRHRRPRLVAPVVRGTGRRLRRAGEALEAWATSPAVRSH
jgi:hypothetical protein